MAKISRDEMKRLNQRIKEREKKMRARFPEIHGKKLDYVEMDSDGGYVCVTIRFTDKTDFYIQFRQRDPKLDCVQYNDISTGNSQRIRTYVGKEEL
jgi:hypothetical protein